MGGMEQVLRVEVSLATSGVSLFAKEYAPWRAVTDGAAPPALGSGVARLVATFHQLQR